MKRILVAPDVDGRFRIEHLKKFLDTFDRGLLGIYLDT
jgi:hypothetical protein